MGAELDRHVFAARSMMGLSRSPQRRLRLTIAWLAACLPTTAPIAASADALPPDLAEAVRAYDEATTSNDIPALAALVADDYMLVNSDTTVQDKQSYLADFTVPGFSLAPYVIERPLQKVWGDTALTGGVLRLRWTLEGAHHSRLLRIAHVWVKEAGDWRIAYTQLTRVPE